MKEGATGNLIATDRGHIGMDDAGNKVSIDVSLMAGDQHLVSTLVPTY